MPLGSVPTKSALAISSSVTVTVEGVPVVSSASVTVTITCPVLFGLTTVPPDFNSLTKSGSKSPSSILPATISALNYSIIGYSNLDFLCIWSSSMILN